MRIISGAMWLVTGTMLLFLVLVVSSDDRLHDTEVFRQRRAHSQIANFITALGAYSMDVGELPTTDQGLEALRRDPGVAGWNGPYMPQDAPLDPWKKPFGYRRLADASAEVFSSSEHDPPIVGTAKPLTR